eukprot:scaffold106798_cov69-Phaeocystis_antarctica.AAC.1
MCAPTQHRAAHTRTCGLRGARAARRRGHIARARCCPAPTSALASRLVCGVSFFRFAYRVRTGAGGVPRPCANGSDATRRGIHVRAPNLVT